MEQKYIEELRSLGFTSDVESVKTVLETRAYHNTYDDGDDSSYAVLTIPTCYDSATEKDILNKLYELFNIYYKHTVSSTRFSTYYCLGCTIKGNAIQFKYEQVLSQKQIVSIIYEMLNFIFDCLREFYTKLDMKNQDSQRKKEIVSKVAKRIRIIKTFIDAKSVSHNYSEYYFPLHQFSF